MIIANMLHSSESHAAAEGDDTEGGASTKRPREEDGSAEAPASKKVDTKEESAPAAASE